MSLLEDRLPEPEPGHAGPTGRPTITASRAEPIGHPQLVMAEATRPEGDNR